MKLKLKAYSMVSSVYFLKVQQVLLVSTKQVLSAFCDEQFLYLFLGVMSQCLTQDPGWFIFVQVTKTKLLSKLGYKILLLSPPYLEQATNQFFRIYNTPYICTMVLAKLKSLLTFGNIVLYIVLIVFDVIYISLTTLLFVEQIIHMQ